MPEFFISRADADKAYADRIARILSDAGYGVTLQQWDFDDRDFMQMIHDGLANGSRVVSLLSPEYLRSDWCTAEWFSILKPDPLNRSGRFLAFMVQPCEPRGLLASKTYCDLTRLLPGSDSLLADVVRAWVTPGRHKGDPKIGPYWRETPCLVHPRIRRVDNFTGRGEQMADIDKALQGDEIGVLAQATLAGLGGIGKSTIARQYAAEVAEVEGAYAGIWWLNASRPAADDADWPGIEASLLELWQAIFPQLPQPKDVTGAAREAWGYISASSRAKPWLLIYDNVDDGKVLEDWRPPDRARALVTTRLQTLKGSRMARIAVAKWALPQATAYLVNEARPRVLTAAEAQQVAAAVDYLPLALSHAAAYLRDTTTAPVSRYLAYLATHMTAVPEGAEYDRAVFATYQAAIAQAENAAPGGAAIMALAAYLEPDNIPVELLELAPDAYPAPLRAMAADPLARDKALSTLHRLSLIEFDETSQTFSLHRMVQAAIKHALGSERESWVKAAVDVMYSAFPEPNSNNWERCSRLASHAVAVAGQDQPPEVLYKSGRLFGAVGKYLEARGGLDGTLALYRRYHEVFTRLTAADPGNTEWQRDLSASYSQVGTILRYQGNLPAALDAFNASLRIAERLAQADPGNAGWQRDLSVSHDRIGDVLSAQGNLPAALDAFNASLRIRERLAQADPGNAGWQADLAASHGKLGQLHVALGDKAEALRLFKAGRAIVAPLAERSGHTLWLRYLGGFDADIAKLDAE